jgi:hypothetical protein
MALQPENEKNGKQIKPKKTGHLLTKLGIVIPGESPSTLEYLTKESNDKNLSPPLEGPSNPLSTSPKLPNAIPQKSKELQLETSGLKKGMPVHQEIPVEPMLNRGRISQSPRSATTLEDANFVSSKVPPPLGALAGNHNFSKSTPNLPIGEDPSNRKYWKKFAKDEEGFPSIYSDVAFRLKLIDHLPFQKLGKVRKNPKILGSVNGPYDITYPHEIFDEFICGRSISTYPFLPDKLSRDGDPICDSYCIQILEDNATISVVTDGCNWGRYSKNYPFIISDHSCIFTITLP